METVDVVVIGSGIGGLCCAALLARYGFQVVVCESHSFPGGAAHAFERQGFHFDSGPSLYSGLSYRPSANPLRQVLDALDEDLPWLTYDAWGCYTIWPYTCKCWSLWLKGSSASISAKATQNGITCQRVIFELR